MSEEFPVPINNWMSWEGGFDLVALTAADLPMPNVIVHVARMVHTPVGSAPAGMIMIPGPTGAPMVMGFVSPDAKVGAYFGPKIFAGTPFEHAPVLVGSIEIGSLGAGSVSAVVKVSGHTIAATMSGLGGLNSYVRQPSAMPPFSQMVLEAIAGSATMSVDGKAVALIIPPIGISGGPAAVWSPTGVYAR
jgi:hypothetical protein